jgi:hypothetical protein
VEPVFLQRWVEAHCDEIRRFMEYEATISTEADLADVLGDSWFRDEDWNSAGYRFVALGEESTGGIVALWIRREHPGPHPVVFFGGEGGSGVLCPSPLAWALVLTYAPAIVEYPSSDLDAPSTLSLTENWMLDEDLDPEQAAEAQNALAKYRKHAQELLGKAPPFEALSTVASADVEEFGQWVSANQQRVDARESVEAERASSAKRSARRAKAKRLSEQGRLPAEQQAEKDGTVFVGKCSYCGAEGETRLVHFEEFRFGICYGCYFSPAWAKD